MTNNSSLGIFPDIPLGQLIGISVGVFSSIGIIANFLVIAVLSISQRRRFSPYRYLITHLTVADLICAIFLLAYVPIELAGHNWLYEKWACKIIYPTITFCTNLSVGTILIIAVERYRGVIFPFKRPWKPWNLWTALIITWVVSLFIIIPNIMVITVTKYQNLVYCNEIWVDKSMQKLYGISFMFIAFFIPLLAIGYMNLHIVIRLRHRDLQPATNSRWQQNRDKRITRVLTSIVICFFICILPNKLLYFVWDVAPQLETDKIKKVRLYLRTIQVLYYARVAIDPLLYCFFDTRFKKDLTNSMKILKGEAFEDSEIYSRNRSRSILSRYRSSTNCDVRSRASTSLSSGDPGKDTLGYHVPAGNRALSITSIKEENAETESNTEDVSHLAPRLRTDSHQYIDQLAGSATPLVEGSLMTNGDELTLTTLDEKEYSAHHDRETSESSCDSATDQNSVYGSATPLVGSRERHSIK